MKYKQNFMAFTMALKNTHIQMQVVPNALSFSSWKLRLLRVIHIGIRVLLEDHLDVSSPVQDLNCNQAESCFSLQVDAHSLLFHAVPPKWGQQQPHSHLQDEGNIVGQFSCWQRARLVTWPLKGQAWCDISNIWAALKRKLGST